MSERRTIGPVDAMWLNMDRPGNLMVIDAVMWFDEAIDPERLGPVVRRRLVERYPVFSQRPAGPSIPFGRSHWEDDSDFDLGRHLRRAVLPAPAGKEALQRFVESRMSVPFDRAHPMWEIILVDGYLGGCALVARFHHSIADGIVLSPRGPGTCWSSAGRAWRSPTSYCWAATRKRPSRASRGSASGRSGPRRERSRRSRG